eukprot:5697402-Prymnesium_polylepis.1
MAKGLQRTPNGLGVGSRELGRAHPAGARGTRRRCARTARRTCPARRRPGVAPPPGGRRVRRRPARR